jgi:hypothetical protein
LGDSFAAFGIQSDSEYDRAVTGNLTGNPETVTYALNSFTTGGFFQIHLNGGISHRWLIVVAPYQYQQQITGNYLNFKYATGIGQITIATPKTTGFNQRMGLRHEFGGGKWFDPDAGSYTEAGPEYSNQNNQLSGLLLPNGRLCPASDVSFATCVSTGTQVTSSTTVQPLTETLHAGGAYWDAGAFAGSVLGFFQSNVRSKPTKPVRLLSYSVSIIAATVHAIL